MKLSSIINEQCDHKFNHIHNQRLDLGSLDNNILIKFLDEQQQSFKRFAGYVARLSDIIDIWLSDEYVQEDVSPFHELSYNNPTIQTNNLSVPFKGNMFQVHYNGPITQTPWLMDTPGHYGPPKHILTQKELELITSAKTEDEGHEIYIKLGYPSGDFRQDILRNIPAHQSRQYEIIINQVVPFTMIAKPNIDLGYGGGIFFVN